LGEAANGSVFRCMEKQTQKCRSL